MTTPLSSPLPRALDRELDRARADLEQLVRLPTVSADPEHESDIAEAARVVAAHASDAGAADVQILDAAGGKPAVVATWPAPEGRPTVLLYAHMDVQPTGPEAEWTSPPFAPAERDGRLYGRGSADDKAGVVMHLAVLRAFGGRPPVGVVLFVEGEEEIGSPTLPALLAEHRDLLRSDVIVIADSANASVDVPAFTTSLRGLVDLFVEVRVLERPVHSGLYGGAVPDALTALCRLLATLHDEAGDVAVPGLAAGSSSAPEPPLDVFCADAGMLAGVELVGTGSVPERLWHKPAIAVLGMDAPAADEASNVLLPTARAKVSMRLSPGQDEHAAMKALTDHLTSHAVWGTQVEVTAGASGGGFSLETTGDVYDVAREVFEQAYGNAPVEAGIGGSIPFIAEFARAYPGATVMVTGVGDPASRWHGIDESLHLGMWGRACLAEALLLERLGVDGVTDVERRLTQVLAGWAAASVVAGAVLCRDPGTRGFGRQTLLWGAVDGAIVVVGARRRAAKGGTDPARLRTVLLVNAGLDVLYLAAGGHLLARTTRWRGDGAAVLVQGGFLLVLDSVAARALRDG